jgi:hypothetical protein
MAHNELKEQGHSIKKVVNNFLGTAAQGQGQNEGHEDFKKNYSNYLQGVTDVLVNQTLSKKKPNPKGSQENLERLKVIT